MKSAVVAVSGQEQAYPVYRFSGSQKLERVGHNPFASLPAAIPTTSLIAPSTIVAGAGDTVVTVTGTGFEERSVVNWDGSPRATVYVSATELTATITTADLASSGSGAITVFTSTPGGGTSTPAETFTITAPFATWNAATMDSNELAISNGDLTVTRVGPIVPGFSSVQTDIGKTTGKWYWELKLDLGANPNFLFGIAPDPHPDNNYPGQTNESYGFQTASGSPGAGLRWFNSGSNSYGGPWGISLDTLMIALDLDNDKIWFGINGVWQASGDPVAGTGQAWNIIERTWHPTIAINDDTTMPVVTANFGASAFTYTPPTGYVGIQ